MIEIVTKNQNKSWIVVGTNFLALGLIFLIISHYAYEDQWFLHLIFFCFKFISRFYQIF